MSSDLLIAIESLPQYNLELFNCFDLANWVRHYYHQSPLPNLSHYYQTYHNDLVADLLDEYCQSSDKSVEHLNLLCLRYKGEAVLATALNLYGIKALYFGNQGKAVLNALDRISFLESVWIFNPSL